MMIQFYGDKNNIDDVVEFLNEWRQKGYNVSQLRKVLEIGEKPLQKLLKAHKYKFSQRLKRYVREDDKQAETQNDYMETSIKKANETYELQVNYNNNTEVIEALKTVKELKEMTNKFEEMYSWYQMQLNVIDIKTCEFKILKNSNETVSRNLRLYIDTNKRLNDFCKEHREFKVQDIVNTALVEFLDKYDK